MRKAYFDNILIIIMLFKNKKIIYEFMTILAFAHVSNFFICNLLANSSWKPVLENVFNRKKSEFLQIIVANNAHTYQPLKKNMQSNAILGDANAMSLLFYLKKNYIKNSNIENNLYIYSEIYTTG